MDGQERFETLERIHFQIAQYVRNQVPLQVANEKYFPVVALNNIVSTREVPLIGRGFGCFTTHGDNRPKKQ